MSDNEVVTSAHGGFTAVGGDEGSVTEVERLRGQLSMALAHVDKAYKEGYRDAKAGKPMASPYDPEVEGDDGLE